MGKVSIITKNQKIVLDEVSRNKYLKHYFYFTGGTALSEFYLQHRYSDDLDFFSEEKLNTEILFSVMSELAKKHHFTFEAELPFESLYRLLIKFPQNNPLQVDFAHYFGKRVRTGKEYNGMAVDSLLDIAINKLASIQQRASVKDYVDYYFLQNEFSLWDLIEGVRVKFRLETDPWVLATDFLRVENFDYLPKMIKSLTLPDLKQFFREKAKELGKKAVY